jgi:hypothetical protein
MGKYGGHMGKYGEPINDLGHMGISLELNSGKIMADIWELPKKMRSCIGLAISACSTVGREFNALCACVQCMHLYHCLTL